MTPKNISTARWPVPQRARIRVRLGRYVLVGRVGRVRTRSTSPPLPAGSWGLCCVAEQVGYGLRSPGGSVRYWRPLRPF